MSAPSGERPACVHHCHENGNARQRKRMEHCHTCSTWTLTDGEVMALWRVLGEQFGKYDHEARRRKLLP